MYRSYRSGDHVLSHICYPRLQVTLPFSVSLASFSSSFTESESALFSSTSSDKGISINITTDGQHITHGDRATLLELFANLIDNAIKYNIPQGKIDISFKKETGFIVTEIIDTGISISEEVLDRVFDRFYRVDKSRLNEIGGIGLGLSICQEIVKLYGGRTEIKSKLRHGTTVSVYSKGDGSVT